LIDPDRSGRSAQTGLRRARNDRVLRGDDLPNRCVAHPVRM